MGPGADAWGYPTRTPPEPKPLRTLCRALCRRPLSITGWSSRDHVPVRRGARWYNKALCRVLSPCGRGSGWGRWKGGSLTTFSKFLGLLNCVQRLHADDFRTMMNTIAERVVCTGFLDCFCRESFKSWLRLVKTCSTPLMASTTNSRL